MVVLLIVWCGVDAPDEPGAAAAAGADRQQPGVHRRCGRLDAAADPAFAARGGATSTARPSPADAGACREEPPHYAFAPNVGMLLGLIGILMAFGHSILAMTGEESLAQVNRELEHPKHKNLMRAGMVIFIYSLLFTSLVSFFAYALIPDDVAAAVLRQPDHRHRDVRGRPDAAQAAVPGLRRHRRLPDAGRRRQHVDRRVERRAEPRVGRRRDDRLVPRAAPEIRHDLPDDQPDRRACSSSRSSAPRQHLHARRGVRVRRRLELRVQGAGDARPALQGQSPQREWKVPFNSGSAATRFRSGSA